MKRKKLASRGAMKRKQRDPANLSELRAQVQQEILNSTRNHPKRFRRKSNGITGLAAGIADYFQTDVTWVRLGLVAGTIFTSGILLIPYSILAYFLPKEDQDQLDGEWIRVEYGQDWPMYSEDLPEVVDRRKVCSDCDTVTKPNAHYCHSCGAKI